MWGCHYSAIAQPCGPSLLLTPLPLYVTIKTQAGGHPWDMWHHLGRVRGRGGSGDAPSSAESRAVPRHAPSESSGVLLGVAAAQLGTSCASVGAGQCGGGAFTTRDPAWARITRPR
jgi:hypothetical protein